jgi:hypothetical protein
MLTPHAKERRTAHASVAQPGGFSARGLIQNLVINAAIPVLLYHLSKRYISDSEIIALSIAAVVPLVASVVELSRSRRLNIIGVTTLLGIAVGLVGIALGGDPKILLIRGSFFTGALGITCFLSLCLPRPLMFYFGRELIAAGDPAKIAAMNAQYEQIPGVRRVHRRITIVWGCAYAGEFALRVLLVLTLPSVVVLAISPVILSVINIGTIAWTIAYANLMRRRAKEEGISVE